MLTDIIVFNENLPPRSAKIELNPFNPDRFKEIKEKFRLTICLIHESAISLLKKDTDNFVFKGIKHPKKHLAYYFKNNEGKVVFIDGNSYRNYGQLKRSVNDFLINEGNRTGNNAFFICISKELFKIGTKRINLPTKFHESGKRLYENPLLNLISTPATCIDLKERYIGNSEPCLLVRQLIAVASQQDFPVLILGESGTGKEVAARAIHDCSKRKYNPFFSINCSAISTELLESELFGYLKGSATDLKRDKKGLWEMADKGTLFLDEIGDLSLKHQVKILRALETGEILPVGATKTVKVDVRIIAATNKNIDVLATDKSNAFREDLYYRISTFIIRTPPLSSHPEDITEIARKIWIEVCKDDKDFHPLSDEVLRCLRFMNWPGNVRMLKNFLQRTHSLFSDSILNEEHLEVVRLQEVESFLKMPKETAGIMQLDDKEYERVILKTEYLLRASLYSAGKDQRKALLEKAKECLEEISC